MNAVLYLGIAILIVVASLLSILAVYTVVEPILKAGRDGAKSVVARRATVIAKRQELWGGVTASPYTTSYYVSFEMESEDRVELEVEDTDYGLIIEGDTGILSSQGDTFKGFQRQQLKAH
ncbi:MAG: DUF2500 domain-containing protein [Akkermansiaceae bacterium]|nr:DUF2500 domain-containing protein [Armatimonadota bacterium]